MAEGVLAEIARSRHADLAARFDAVSLDALRDRAVRTKRTLAGALGQPGSRFVLEIKKASPSRGKIRAQADVAKLARGYSGVADVLSVLVETRHFGGSLDDLRLARTAFDGPILAKDFFLDPRQVVEARIAGADAVLVILGMVSDDEAKRLSETARLLGMDVLVEANDAAEVERAVALESRMIGVNARNLETLEVDRDGQLELLASLPEGSLRIAESGVASRADVEAARDAGAQAVLVGTSLMRSPELLGELVGVPR